MNRPGFKKILSLAALLGACAFFMFAQPASAQPLEELTLERIRGTEDDWELRSQEGKILGTVKNLKNETFRIYDAGGNYNGFVYQSGEWVPQDARQKRELQLGYAQVRLYIDIVSAAGLAAPESRTLEAIKKGGAEGEWGLQDQNGRTAGRVVKSETSFKFYDDGMNFMGYINPSGNWLPKLGINRREMRISPDQAQFYLDVWEALQGVGR